LAGIAAAVPAEKQRVFREFLRFRAYRVQGWQPIRLLLWGVLEGIAAKTGAEPYAG
jgi:hypothetical protein